MSHSPSYTSQNCEQYATVQQIVLERSLKVLSLQENVVLGQMMATLMQ